MSGDRIYSAELKGGGQCPNCNKILDGFTSVVGEVRPEPGDFTICVYCDVWLIINDDGRTYRLLQQADLDWAPRHVVDQIKTMGILLAKIKTRQED